MSHFIRFPDSFPTTLRAVYQIFTPHPLVQMLRLKYEYYCQGAHRLTLFIMLLLTSAKTVTGKETHKDFPVIEHC